MYTYNTEDCKRFDEKGNNLIDARDKALGITRKYEDETKECVFKMLKVNEKLMKKRKKKKKRKRGSTSPPAPILATQNVRMGRAILVSIAIMRQIIQC